MENENLKPVQTIPPFTKMIMTIGALPSSFYSSMSYYEAMVWLYEYLKNTIIPTVNANGEAVIELQEKFIELKEDFETLENWVHEYEETQLPIEVQNKLDEMATDGTLQDLLDEIMKYKGLLTFNNVEEMKESTNIENGSFGQTSGFYTTGDGGSALYKIRLKEVNETPNEMDVISLNDNTLVAELVNNLNDVLCYGVEKNDINENNHIIINYVMNKMLYAYCNETITVKNTIYLNVSNATFKFNRLYYTGSSYAIQVVGYMPRIDGNTIISSYDGLRVGGDILVSGLVVNLNHIQAENNAVILQRNVGQTGIQDSQFFINRLNYKNHGILFDLTNGWIGQVSFYNTFFGDDSNLSENYAIYMNCSNNGMTGLDIYNPSFEGAKGGIYCSTTGIVTSKFIEHLNIVNARTSEFSINNSHKLLKFITASSINNIRVEGEISFDQIDISALDFSEFYGIQGSLKLKGVIYGNSYRPLLRSTPYLGQNVNLGYKKALINQGYKEVDIFSLSEDTTILPTASNIVISNSNDHKLEIRLTDDNINFIGNYNIYLLTNTTVELLNKDGTVARTISASAGDCIKLTSESTWSSNDVQVQYVKIASAYAGSITG